MKYKFFLLALFPLLVTSCIQINTTQSFEINGFAPIYGDFQSLGTVTFENPKPIENAGKIFYLNQYLYIVESGEGIHVYNNEDPENPVNEAFINVPGCYNVAVKGTNLYVNNYADLVVIDVSNISSPTTVQRFANQLGDHSDYFTKPNGSYLCPEEGRIVVGWEETTFSSNECYQTN